tara:strand:- start:2120 stop:2554 length:435 start_codon:yes stop_codon:yes gene_type:complete
MARALVKARVLPAHMERADSLRESWSYHVPDGPFPTRNLVLASALTKGLRRLDRSLTEGFEPVVLLPVSGPARDHPRVRFDRNLLAFADRLRGPLYHLRCIQAPEDEQPAYPSRAHILSVSLQIGLDEVARLYAEPASLPLHAS